ncbi:P-II family nitrogen regulator [Methanolobus chelungpuianus]|uniref:Nitrogen fixation protein NifD n=1 Tax=Methanolobus chelungpuianus TaxID=502115 RepID=A0AAE3H9W8_9EURY|nr:P-II family nitrogen regulator [Methanolobus chelungpuianus]MCQ6961888.1 nitrogen fixation protein NifD [Methanolobus chelungpuianus]
MQMVRAIIRPNKVTEVVEELEKGGFVSLTKIDVFGRGKQRGVHTADIHFDELPKTMLMMVVEDGKTSGVIDIIKKSAHTGKYGDGKIFVNPVQSAYTIRTGECGL